MMANIKIGVIGCGNMASVVVRALHRSSQNNDLHFKTYTPSKSKARELAKQVDGVVMESLEEVNDCEFVIIACKPQQFSSLSQKLRPMDLRGKCIISIMAAVSVEQIKSQLGDLNVVRLMPSMPMEVDEGISLLHFRDTVSEQQKDFLREVLKPSSLVIELRSEEIFDRLTVISSSGPAYIYYFMNVMEEKLRSWDVEEETCRMLVAQLFRGSSSNALANGSKSLNSLINMVTSNKGVTIAAIESFRLNDVGQNISQGLDSAAKRSSMIANELGNT